MTDNERIQMIRNNLEWEKLFHHSEIRFLLSQLDQANQTVAMLQQQMEYWRSSSDQFADTIRDRDKTIAELRVKYEPKPHNFAVGDRVWHEKYRCGATIIEISKSGKKVRVKWNNEHWYQSYVYPSSLKALTVSKQEESAEDGDAN